MIIDKKVNFANIFSEIHITDLYTDSFENLPIFLKNRKMLLFQKVTFSGLLACLKRLFNKSTNTSNGTHLYANYIYDAGKNFQDHLDR